jgi:glycosyltransferase involved in cell wall biosynthesis
MIIMDRFNPRITVLMPVYNGEMYLNCTIDSILNQTFGDFEFIIIDDGSMDKSVEIINPYGDPRIKLIKNEVNLGLIKTLNKGLTYAKGEYIVRMDCDDFSVHVRRGDYERIPQIAMVSGGICTIEYYTKCPDFIKCKVKDPIIYFFSDEIEWVKENIYEENAVYVDWNKDKKSYIDMQLMSCCKHIIREMVDQDLILKNMIIY